MPNDIPYDTKPRPALKQNKIVIGISNSHMTSNAFVLLPYSFTTKYLIRNNLEWLQIGNLYAMFRTTVFYKVDVYI